MSKFHSHNAFPTRSSDRNTDFPSFCPDCGDEWDGEHCSSCCPLGVGPCEDFACTPVFGPHAPWHLRNLHLQPVKS